MDIFKPASPEEVIERKRLYELEKIKDWCDRTGVKYTEDDKGNIIKFDKSTIENKDNDGYTALMDASSSNLIEIVKLLLDNGADVNIKNRYGNTALMDAANNNNIEIVKLLIDNGADVNAKDNDGDTALIYASWNNKIDIAKLLLNKGADVNVVSMYAKTNEMKKLLLIYKENI